MSSLDSVPSDEIIEFELPSVKISANEIATITSNRSEATQTFTAVLLGELPHSPS